MMQTSAIKNVFDEMYVTISQPNLTKTDFYYMEPVGKLANTDGFDVYDDYFWGAYKSVGGYENYYIRTNEHIGITLDMGKEEFRIRASIEIGNERILLCYIYRRDEKKLELEPLFLFTGKYDETGTATDTDDAAVVEEFFFRNNITREKLEEYKHYFLYEKVLPDWVIGNGDRSRFNVDNYGDFEVEDNSFAKLGEDWGKQGCFGLCLDWILGTNF